MKSQPEKQIIAIQVLPKKFGQPDNEIWWNNRM